MGCKMFEGIVLFTKAREKIPLYVTVWLLSVGEVYDAAPIWLILELLKKIMRLTLNLLQIIKLKNLYCP